MPVCWITLGLVLLAIVVRGAIGIRRALRSLRDADDRGRMTW